MKPTDNEPDKLQEIAGSSNQVFSLDSVQPEPVVSVSQNIENSSSANLDVQSELAPSNDSLPVIDNFNTGSEANMVASDYQTTPLVPQPSMNENVSELSPSEPTADYLVSPIEVTNPASNTSESPTSENIQVNPGMTGFKLGGVENKNNKSNFLKAGLISLMAVLVLGIGSVAAYYGYILPNKPVNVLSQSVLDSLKSSQYYDINANLSTTYNGLPISAVLKTSTNTSNKNSSLNLAVSFLGTQYLNLNGIFVNNNFYINLGNLSGLASLFTKIQPGSSSLLSTVSSQFSNKWIMLSPTAITNANLSCLKGSSSLFNSNDFNLLVNDYSHNNFMNVTSTSNVMLNNVPSEEFQAQISTDKIVNFLNDSSISKLSFVSTLNSCSNKNNSSTINKIKSNHSTTDITFWMDKTNHKINQIQYLNNSNGSSKILVNVSYNPVTITAPGSFMTSTQFSQILQQDLSNPSMSSQFLGLVVGLTSNLSSITTK